MNQKEPIIIEELNSSSDLFGIDENIFEKILKKDNLHVSINKLEQINYINKNFYGGRGEKLVVKVHYNENKETMFFIKKHCQKNPNEAVHYKYLTQFNAPIPELYAYYCNENQHDVIISEVIKPFYVEDDPVFMLNKDILKPFVEATALFNSVKINDEYKKKIIKNCDLLNDYLKPFQSKLITIFDSIETVPIYHDLKNRVTKKSEEKILKIHMNICESIGEMEKGLYHWDHKPRNMGWSEAQNKYVIFDLEDTLWAPRFYNIGMWLGGNDKLEEKYTAREDLAKIYLSIYNEENNKNISIDCLLNESFPLWVAYKIEMLIYCFYESGVNPYGLWNREPREYKKEMEEKFVYYLDLLCNL